MFLKPHRELDIVVMKFDNLLLSGWSFNKGDKKIPIDELDLPKNVLKRNPVPATFVYSDDHQWDRILIKEVQKTAEMAGLTGDDIQGFLGIHNGIDRHPEGASPVTMAAFPKTKGFGFDFSLGCASVILAAQIAGTHFIHPEVNNIIVGSVQMTTQYTDNCSDGNCIFADSIGSFAFSKGEHGNKVKYVEISTNPYFRDMFILNNQAKYQLANLQKGKELSEYMVKTFANHMRKACLAMKTYPKDIDFIAISCSTYAATRMVLDQMKFPLEKTGIECLRQVPHMGTNDLLFQLDYGLENGLIKKGSKILVSGTSLGFSMGTMGIEWGD
ncbi:MAG: hypothetical protein D6732_27115 [Methanobacteriota archaeon]|nr:MAG: hypothetical protein D6732_27115 [Euryarchaeota archaeon]